jgi:hypothetical protein
MKLLLCAFEQLLGLKINFYKSEIFCYRAARDRQSEFAQIFRCVLGSYPFCYLKIPMHHKTFLSKDWKHIEERFQKKG